MPDDGSDEVFGRYSAMVGSGDGSLDVHQRVEFDLGRGRRGLQAQDVRPCDPWPLSGGILRLLRPGRPVSAPAPLATFGGLSMCSRPSGSVPVVTFRQSCPFSCGQSVLDAAAR